MASSGLLLLLLLLLWRRFSHRGSRQWCRRHLGSLLSQNGKGRCCSPALLAAAHPAGSLAYINPKSVCAPNSGTEDLFFKSERHFWIPLLLGLSLMSHQHVGGPCLGSNAINLKLHKFGLGDGFAHLLRPANSRKHHTAPTFSMPSLNWWATFLTCTRSKKGMLVLSNCFALEESTTAGSATQNPAASSFWRAGPTVVTLPVAIVFCTIHQATSTTFFWCQPPA